MAKFGFDPFGIMRDLQERAQFLLNADKQLAEVVEVLRDTHRILAKLEAIVDRMDETTRGLPDLDVSRVERLESAVLNIERATLSLETAMGALPKRWIRRIERVRADEP